MTNSETSSTLSLREEAREQEYRNTHHLEERIQPGANEEQFRTFEVNLE